MPEHPDTPERLVAIEQTLAGRGWLGWERREAPPAQEDQLELVHDRAPDRAAQGDGASGRRCDRRGHVRRRGLLPGGAACRRRRVRDDEGVGAGEADVAFCGVRPSGHHAEPGRAMGFCLFNNVAVAAEYAICELGLRRVFVLDWDVHHGNGTAEAFRRRPDVLFASIHQGGIYPGTGPLGDSGSGPGEGYTINLPVPAGSEEDLWLSLLEHWCCRPPASFEPDLVLISAGFDAHRADPLASCRLETSSFAEMARHVRDFAERAGAPLGAVLEGGYEPVALAESVCATLAALGSDEPPRSSAPEALLTSRAAAHVAHYWPL